MLRHDENVTAPFQVWGRAGAAFLLGDQIRARMDCPATVKAVRVLSEKWPKTYAKLIDRHGE